MRRIESLPHVEISDEETERILDVLKVWNYAYRYAKDGEISTVIKVLTIEVNHRNRPYVIKGLIGIYVAKLKEKINNEIKNIRIEGLLC